MTAYKTFALAIKKLFLSSINRELINGYLLPTPSLRTFFPSRIGRRQEHRKTRGMQRIYYMQQPEYSSINAKFIYFNNAS